MPYASDDAHDSLPTHRCRHGQHTNAAFTPRQLCFACQPSQQRRTPADTRRSTAAHPALFCHPQVPSAPCPLHRSVGWPVPLPVRLTRTPPYRGVTTSILVATVRVDFRRGEAKSVGMPACMTSGDGAARRAHIAKPAAGTASANADASGAAISDDRASQPASSHTGVASTGWTVAWMASVAISQVHTHTHRVRAHRR
jgi:hypothetical protein